MNRKTLFNIHFYLSSFFTPFLLIIAITGTSYLFGQKGSLESTLIKTKIILTKENKKEQIQTILSQIDSTYRFEYIKDRGSEIQTRPTTRDYYNLNKDDDGTFSLYKVSPNFLSRIIEVHKGHGPKILKHFQKILGICLILIIISGLWLSMLMKKRVKEYFVSGAIGGLALLLLFLL